MYLTEDKRGRREPVNIAALAVLAGVSEEALRRAMPELPSPAELAGLRWVLGRARPHAAVQGLACRRCAAICGDQRIIRWQTHENVMCLRHQLWTHVLHCGPRTQFDLREHPEIVAAAFGVGRDGRRGHFFLAWHQVSQEETAARFRFQVAACSRLKAWRARRRSRCR